ncbi:Nn.00g011620.m01.CDS01 [Neocucurbitaria sp. VM-36]
MKWLLALLPLAAAAPALPDVNLGEAPPAGQVKIRGVSYGGTGCPQGTMSSQISADRSVVTLIFDSYIASIGPGIAVTEQRKNCQLNVDLEYPGGFQYSILSADYRGYAAIQKGISGTLKSTYYFSGQTAQTSTEYGFTGPVNGDYLKHDEADSTSIVWSPCGATGMLNINSQVRLTSTNTSATGLLTTDSTDLKFTQVVYVQWQKCTK